MKWKLAIPALLLVLPLISATPAIALDWSLGAELGGSIFMPDEENAEDVTTFSWPTVGPVFSQIGGLRLSFTGSRPTHEIWVGTSLFSMTSGGHTTSNVMVTGNYQYNFPNQGRLTPYVTAGVGFVNAGRDDNATGAVYGAGAGLSRRVSDGAGRFRAEVRYDQQTEGKSHGFVSVPKGGSFGLKLGFDLWIR